ncbi:Pycsar system effector family protein [uncultured Winogradskyella sp.]|uniref:Pycsar system effector family protein n=1 Tax=uncultured Winogradskyella sp. TaxID=395353 RepID=UPI00261BA662|nr:Pycsar system effector family protein [uncultured Winogradskyella sp.]
MATIIETTDKYVLDLFTKHLPNTFTYHNYEHTKRVWKSTKEIIENSEISANESEILLLASLLHDIGYTKTRDGHEEESAKMATEFLKSQNVDGKIIDGVNECIIATKFDRIPENKLEEIIKDADSSHFGKKYFTEVSELLRTELELQGIKVYSSKEWLKENIRILSKKHKFYSDYAKLEWGTRKKKNLAKLMKSKLKQRSKDSKEELKARYKVKYKNESSERGVQTLFRVALRNHIKLSDIADTKANILLSVNAIIISLVLSNLISKLDNPSNSYMIVPTIIFVIFSVISVILSIVATRPNVTRGQFTKEDVKDKKVNLLFFGNFHKMELGEFEWAIEEMLKDKDYIYSSLSKDLYFLGKVLSRKYRILRITYTIFMAGIVISVLAFAIAFKTQAQ